MNIKQANIFLYNQAQIAMAYETNLTVFNCSLEINRFDD